MSQPSTMFDGFSVPKPTPGMIADAYQAIAKVLAGQGWKERAGTLVHDLDNKVTFDNQIAPTHVTIVIDDLMSTCGAVLGTSVVGVSAAAGAALRSVAYHLTVGAGDDLYDPNNPRWHSKTGSWSGVNNGFEPNAADVKSAVGAAMTLMKG